MFTNLKAEMARKGLTAEILARALGINSSTMSAKLNKYDRLKLSECKKIQQTYFPCLSIDYLFSTEENQKSA